MISELAHWDVWGVRALNLGLGSPAFDWLFVAASWVGEDRGLAIALVIYVLSPRVRPHMKTFLVAVGGATIALMLIRLGIARPRPCIALVGLRHVVAPIAEHNSFPSGHAALAGVLLDAAIRGHWVGWLGFVTFAMLSAVSRVYLGMHYPSDVLAGLAIGAGLHELARVVVRRRTRAASATVAQGQPGALP